MSELQEKQKTLAKELRDANQQRKLAVDDFTDINEKCVHVASMLNANLISQSCKMLSRLCVIAQCTVFDHNGMQ